MAVCACVCVHLGVSDSRDSCQGWCPPTQRFGVAPEQPEDKRSKRMQTIQGRCEGKEVGGWMIEQRKRRGVKHRGDELSQFRERQFDG